MGPLVILESKASASMILIYFQNSPVVALESLIYGKDNFPQNSS